MPGSTLVRRLRSLRYEVRDRSMVPAFAPGDRLLVDPSEYRRRPPAAGEVVVLIDPEDRRRRLLKRVAAVGPAPATGLPPDLPLPPGHVLVLSDHRAEGRDSRWFGPVPVGDLVGPVWFRYAPRSRRGGLPG
jgi:signal peptidase I